MKRRIITIVTIIFFAHLSVFSQTNVSGKAHPRYYLIVGAYSTLQDANDAVDNLKLKGFAAEVVPGLTDYGTYRVAYCSYDDKDAAQQKTNQMKAQGYTSVWIYTGNVTDTNVQNNAPVTNNQNKGKITTQEQPPQFKNADERAAALKKALNRASAAEDIANQSKSKEDWQSVIEEYKNVTKIDPANSLSYYKIGYASETIEDYDNAIIYYNKYLQVDPKSSIAEKVQTNIDKLEYKRDKSKKQVVLSKSVNGLWESDLIDKKTKRPYWIFTIDQFDNDMRVSVSPKSFLYKPAFTFPTAIALKDKNKLHFMFTTDVNINIKEDLNAASSILNALDGVQSAVSSVPVIGAAASIIGAVPAKAKNDKSTYIFSLDLSDTTKLSGKYNAKEYETISGQSPKTLSDNIVDLTLTKTTQSNLDNLKVSKIYHPTSAFLLSFVCPGIGQFLNKQTGKGFIFLGSAVVLTAFILTVGIDRETDTEPDGTTYTWAMGPNALGIVLIGVGGIDYLWSLLDAPISASKLNKQYGYTSNTIYENKNLCLKLNPGITSSLAFSGNRTVATGMGLSLCFK